MSYGSWGIEEKTQNILSMKYDSYQKPGLSPSISLLEFGREQSMLKGVFTSQRYIYIYFFFHDWQNSVFKNMLTCIKSLNLNWIETDLGMLTINYWLIAIKNLPGDIKLLTINWKSRGASVLCHWKLNHEGLHVPLHDLRNARRQSFGVVKAGVGNFAASHDGC